MRGAGLLPRGSGKQQTHLHPRLLPRLAGWAGGNTEEPGVSLWSTDWVKTCAWTPGHSQEPWAPVIVLVFGDITTGRRARQGTARALEPNCLDSDAGPAALRQCDLGKAAQHFGASVSCPQNGPLPVVRGG